MAELSLTVLADYVCPYCYLAESAVARLRAEGLDVRTAPFELRPAGVPLPAPTAAWLQEAWRMKVAPLAEELGVVMRYPAITTRTRKAHEAVAFARDAGLGTELHEALYRAYWEDGRDIGRIDVLVEIGGGVGLDRGALRVALDIDAWTEMVAAQLAWAAEQRIQAVPAYVLQRGPDAAGELRVGLQRYEQLKEWTGHDV